MPARIGQRLTHPRLQVKAKRVSRWVGFFDDADVAVDAVLFAELNALLDLIEGGRPVPERFYRTSGGRDHLLLDHGVMHLHLGHPGSDALVFLIQYDAEVVLLGTGSHAAFDSGRRAVWRNLRTAADVRAAKLERFQAIEKESAEAARREAVAAGVARLKSPRRRNRSPEED